MQAEAEPTWDIAQLFPAQGHWDEDEYLALETNHLIEYTHGNLEENSTRSMAYSKRASRLHLFC
jgi:uncharacterized protein YndB with AHSA1/START domain